MLKRLKNLVRNIDILSRETLPDKEISFDVGDGKAVFFSEITEEEYEKETYEDSGWPAVFKKFGL